ncbi:MAG: hypothetical protein J3R72DRAFT_471404 [Linnemannia gamsii]|nr:MAG: hypothetical protein J3R72DRAFT_471404 [Linnemannia gamsii]
MADKIQHLKDDHARYFGATTQLNKEMPYGKTSSDEESSEQAVHDYLFDISVRQWSVRDFSRITATPPRSLQASTRSGDVIRWTKQSGPTPIRGSSLWRSDLQEERDQPIREVYYEEAVAMPYDYQSFGDFLTSLLSLDSSSSLSSSYPLLNHPYLHQQHISSNMDNNSSRSMDERQYLPGTSTNTLTHDEVASLKESFKAFDKNGDGSINATELRSLLRIVGERLKAKHISDTMQEFDTNKKDHINFEDFLALVSKITKSKVPIAL